MNWITDVSIKLKNKNATLFSKNSDCLQELTHLINAQNHQTMVLWAFDFAEESVKKLEEKYPNELRPRKALEITKLWAAGEVKMPVAKREILNCHAFAKEITDLEDIALCHAIGQACGVVHANGHALGFPIYDLTAIVRRVGIENCEKLIEKRIHEYIDKINYWKNNYKIYDGKWAGFMQREKTTNRNER